MQSSTAKETWAQKPKGVGASDRITLAAVAEKILGDKKAAPMTPAWGFTKGFLPQYSHGNLYHVGEKCSAVLSLKNVQMCVNVSANGCVWQGGL